MFGLPNGGALVLVSRLTRFEGVGYHERSMEQPATHSPSSRELAALLGARLYEPLADLRLRCRLYQAFNGFLRLFLTLILTGLAQLGLDYWLRFSLDQRAVLNGVLTLVWLYVIWRYIVLPLRRPLPDRLLAAWVDRTHPALREHLATAIELHETRTADSPQLIEAVLRDAADAAQRVSFLDVLDHRRSAWRGAGFGAAALLIACAWVVFPDMMNTWFARNWLMQEIPWKQDTYITPLDFDAATLRRRMPRGEEVEIRAEIKGRAPRSATVIWRAADGREGRTPMTQIGGLRLTAVLDPLSATLTFRIVGGDERTREYTIELIEAPQALATIARITPPAYVEQPPIELEQQTFIELLAGSRLDLDVRVNKALARATLLGPAGPVGDVTRAADRVRVALPQPAAGVYRLELEDHDGWKDRNPVQFTVKITADRPPGVQLRLIGAGELVTPSAELTLAVEAEDSYGLARATALAQRNEMAAIELPLPGFSPRQRRTTAELTWSLNAAGVALGDRLRLWAEAADFDPSGPNIGRVPPLELRVVSVDEFQAEMARRELELRRDFEHLLNAQRTLDDGLRRLLAELPDGVSPSAAQTQRLAGLSRQQAAHATRTLAIATRFAQILAELRTNRLNRPAVERRMQEQIISPLERLGREVMPPAAAVMADLRTTLSPAVRTQAAAQQAEILARMKTILAGMLEWEGYREAVALLQDIIAQQGNLRAETLQLLEKQVESIVELELEPLPGDQGGRQPASQPTTAPNSVQPDGE